MVGWRALGPALLVVLTFAACGSTSKTSTPAAMTPVETHANPEAEQQGTAQTESASSEPLVQPAETQQAETKTGKDKFSGQDAINYEDAEAVCGSHPRAQIARELGLPSNTGPGDIAHAYSHTYTGTSQQAVFEGCLAGVR